MERGSPAILRRWSSRCPCPASSRTTALRSRLVTCSPAGPEFFQVRDLRLQIGDLFGELLLARRFGFRLGPRALRPALGPWPERLRASGPVLAAPALQRRDARDPVSGHDLRLGHSALDAVARRGDLRLPVVPSAAVASHDRLLAAGPVQPDPVSRGIRRYGKPTGEDALAGTGLDEFQRLAAEPVVVMSPPILAHMREPHLRSSNLNFFSPTIGVRFTKTPGASRTHETHVRDHSRPAPPSGPKRDGAARSHFRRNPENSTSVTVESRRPGLLPPVCCADAPPPRGGARNPLGPRTGILLPGAQCVFGRQPAEYPGKMAEVSTYRPGGDAHGGAKP